jgi:hypothetical protein
MEGRRIIHNKRNFMRDLMVPRSSTGRFIGQQERRKPANGRKVPGEILNVSQLPCSGFYTSVRLHSTM